MKIIEYKKIDTNNYENISFLRIDPEDLSVTLKEIIETFSDLSWISKFDKEYLRISFSERANNTALYLKNKILNNDEDKITEDSGEYLVSELARKALVEKLEYLDIPLAELFKKKVSGNPGFDFYSANKSDVIIFGEAKYSSTQNAYGRGMEQVDRFIEEKQDIADLPDIDIFFKDESKQMVVNGDKAFAIAFSSKETASEIIIKGIMKNLHYKNITCNKEVIFLAVNV